MIMEKIFNISEYIYPLNFINSWIQDFIEVSELTYSSWELTIKWDSIEDIDLVFNEFINYVTWLINES